MFKLFTLSTHPTTQAIGIKKILTPVNIILRTSMNSMYWVFIRFSLIMLRRGVSYLKTVMTGTNGNWMTLIGGAALKIAPYELS